MSKVRVAFLGTPEFAARCLKGLLSDEHYEVVGVVTQPDRPSGRNLQLKPSPVKSIAEAKRIPVLTPESLKSAPSDVEKIKSWGAEVGVVVAYGQILTQEFLSLFPYGCVNIHASLLPRWRGAAPIQRAIEAGDVGTGVVLQKMVLKLDAGDVLGVRKVKITDDMNSLQLHDILADLSVELLHIEMMDYIRGNLVGASQDESGVTYAKKIDKSESLINWDASSVDIDRKIRAFAWGPGCYFIFNEKKIKILKARSLDKISENHLPAGSIAEVFKDSFTVACGKGFLQIYELQPESKSRMKVEDFLRGNPIKRGDLI